MTAGAIKSPAIIALRKPEPGKPNHLIDVLTRIELTCDTDDVNIYFTVNGSKPEPFQTLGKKATYQYKTPFTLPMGKRVVKAVSVSRNGARISSVVTKEFEVDYVKTDEDGGGMEDSYGFLKDIGPGPKLNAANREAARSYIHNLLKTDNAWGENLIDYSGKKKESQSMSGMRVSFSDTILTKDGDSLSVGLLPDGKGIKKMDSYISNRELKNGKSGFKNGHYLDKPKPRCLTCMAPYPDDPNESICSVCYATLPKGQPSGDGDGSRLSQCNYCQSMVPAHLSMCLVCDMPMQKQNSSIALEPLICPVCRTSNASYADKCVICYEPLTSASQENYFPMERLKSQHALSSGDPNSITCFRCGLLNPSGSTKCTWCFAGPLHDNHNGLTLPLPLSTTANNGSDKLALQIERSGKGTIMCFHCTATNDNLSRFCSQCGHLLELPPPPEGGSTTWQSFTLPLQTATRTQPNQNPEIQKHLLQTFHRKPSHSDAGTQTVGPFQSTSSKDAQQKLKETEAEMRARIEKEVQERSELLTSVSPGKGYWKKQMDHIVAHMKAYARNNAEFRAVIGEPRIGKIITAQAQEDTFELNLNITFALKNSPMNESNINGERGDTIYSSAIHHRPFSKTSGSTPHYSIRGPHSMYVSSPPSRMYYYGGDGRPPPASNLRNMRPMSSGTTRTSHRHRPGSVDTFYSADTASVGSNSTTERSKRVSSASGRRQRRVRKSSARSNSSKKDELKLSSSDKALLKEIGKKGEGRELETHQAIDEGANPNLLNKEGIPALVIAIRNKHKEAVSALIHGGADIQLQFGEKGNTPLHEAVLLGFSGDEILDILLRAGANPQSKNSRGESAYDLAVKSGQDAVIKRLAASMGLAKLNRMLQPKQTEEQKKPSF